MKAKVIGAVVVTVLSLATSQGFGWTQYKDGGTHNISSTINDDVWVDYQAPGMQTTVNVLEGASIHNPYILQGFHESRIDIYGGYLAVIYRQDAGERKRGPNSSVH